MVAYGELTVMGVWLALLVASSRNRRDAVGTVLLAVAPLVVALFEVVNETVWQATQYSSGFSRLRLYPFRVPLAVLGGGAVYVYLVRAAGLGLLRGTANLRAINWLPREFRYLALLALLTGSAWLVEWTGIRLGLWHWVRGQRWDVAFFEGVYLYYLGFVLVSILYAGVVAWLAGAAVGERR